MTPAFGFSVGDFIATIALCTKVAKALKDTGSVIAEYQQVIIEIEGLQHALTQLAALEPTESNIDQVNAIRRMALACSLPMQAFLSKLEKYETDMSPFATGKSFRSAAKKAQYAVFMADEVKTMRAMISGKVISINMLLATHASQSLSRTEGRMSSDQRNLLASLQEARDEMSQIRQDIENMDTATTTSREQLRQEMEAQLNRISNDTTSTKRTISALTVGVTSVSTSIGTLCGLGAQIISILRVFPAELRTLLNSVVRTNMQIYTLLLEVHRISAQPTLRLSSNIVIEDALGQIRSLPFEWFRHWEPLEGHLRAEFKNRLGGERVERGEFRLIYAKRPLVSIGRENWSEAITAGAELIMLMLLSNPGFHEASSCPRQSCNGKTALQDPKQALLTCPECGLRFIPQLAVDENMDVNMMEQLQLEEDSRLFGRRSEPRIQDISDLRVINPTQQSHGRFEEETVISNSSIVRQGAKKRDIPPGNESSPSEAPIYAWLSGTEPPEDPHSVLQWREEEDGRQVKRQKRNIEDLEVLRNVQISFSLKDNLRRCDNQPEPTAKTVPSGHWQPDSGAYVFFRNIQDQYPSLEEAVAWRFAVMNWKRLKSLQEKRCMEPYPVPFLSHPPLPTEEKPVDIPQSSSSEGSAPPAPKEGCSVSDLLGLGGKTSGEKKVCSLPLPSSLVCDPEFGYIAACDLCQQSVHVRHKRDWSNHVMDDLLPYMCPISQCATGDSTYKRRRELNAHLLAFHPHEPCQRCFFCGTETLSEPLKHIGHHMEEVAFGVLNTAYEQWSYDDTNSYTSEAPAAPFVPHPSHEANKEYETLSTDDDPPSLSLPKTDIPKLLKNICETCGKSFTRVENLKRHELSHIREKLHKCGTCSRSFARREHLRRHEHSHTKEKPFECPQCTRCFARPDLLLRHQKKLHQQQQGESISELLRKVEGGQDTGDRANYWTQSSHPPSSASSVNSHLRSPHDSELGNNEHEQEGKAHHKKSDHVSFDAQDFGHEDYNRQMIRNYSGWRRDKLDITPYLYGCTYPKCNVRFREKSRWRRHEAQNHYQQEGFLCQQFFPGTQTPCGELFQGFYSRALFEAHIHDKHDVLNSAQIKHEAGICRIGQGGTYQFWCGFCRALVKLKTNIVVGWDERFEHIGLHFEKESKRIEEWYCMEAKKTKGEQFGDKWINF